MLVSSTNIFDMKQTNVIAAWAEQRNAAAGGLRSVGPVLYAGDRPVACWLDRADEDGAQIALYALHLGRAYLRSGINAAVDSIWGTSLEVPCPLPTPEQHAQNIGHLVYTWQHAILTAARSTRYALGHYQSSQQYGATAKLYAWAFGLSEPKPVISREIWLRARRNAAANRREKPEPQPTRDMLRAIWRSGRDPGTKFLGPVMLRLSTDRKTIETSAGEKVAISNAPLSVLWGMARESREQRRTVIWRIVSERPRIGRWSVHAIRTDGSMQIGCHTLSFAELTRLAVELGLR
jgi:hypothetical protein